ncbi:MAG: PepSY domain-containing protein [Caulobacteraceae bacterium]
MRIARTILALAALAMAFASHAQEHRGRGGGRPGGMGHGFFGAPRYAHGGEFTRGGPAYGGPHYAPVPYGPRPYPPPAYGPYGSPYRGQAMGGRWRDQEEFLRQGVRHGQLAPLGRVIGNIRHITPGRQLDAGLEYLGPRLVYRVRWMTARGRRIDYYVDAATGAILSGR